jgi:hypothetical protein
VQAPDYEHNGEGCSLPKRYNKGNGSATQRKSRNGSGDGSSSGNGRAQGPSAGKLSPQQIAVILALLSNSLFVQSLLVDKDQTVQIVLEGSLKRKSRMDMLLDELSKMSMGELMDSLKGRL